ncbi:choline dehydrogenase [Hypoxylon sp. NC1633]|nr:choline dehydrogenase [Hypoxylon sp. NC1633]
MFISVQILTTYDYVIVGGGTAGLALAARLSEDDSTSVAVVEAGTYYQITNPMLSSTPMGTSAFAGASPSDTNPGVDWSFVTIPQVGLNERIIHYPQGKCLGGSSGRNAMIYQRPDVGSLQQWADEVGDESYTFENMLPYYQKSCHFTAPGPSRLSNTTTGYSTSAFSTDGGPLQVSYPNNVRPVSTYLGSAYEEIGIPVTEDFNSGRLNGSQFCATTIDPTTGFRSSSQTSFLDASQARPNLKIYQLTMAKKVIFDSNKRATGVDIDSGITLSVRKEVILSAGAFKSPQLLMVSGVGPVATLEKLNITVIADRPGVGQNMTDHTMSGPSYRMAMETLGTVASNPANFIPLLTQYFTTAQGPLTNPGTEYIAWEKVPRNLVSNSTASAISKNPDSWPDLEYLSIESFYGNWSVPLHDTPMDGYNYYTVLSIVVTPKSRGNVTISSADTSDPPIINPNWLADPTDLDLMTAGYRRIRAMFTSDAMRPALADPVEYYPGPEVETDEQLHEVFRNTAATVYHASVTCRMGCRDDPNAVVDSDAKVIGVTGLRVVDASAFALLPPGHPQSTIYALAEKITDAIKNGH